MQPKITSVAMKQIWIGFLIFAAIAATGYATSDYDPRSLSGSTTPHIKRHAQNGLSDVESKSEIAVAIRDPVQIWGGANSVYNNPTSLLGGSNSIIKKPENLTKQLAGQAFEKDIAASDKECRERLRQLGVVIATGPCADVG